VLAAFRAGPEPTLLPGGQGRTWRAGDVVLKPVEDPAQHDWVCAAWESWPADAGVNVPVPLRAPDGAWQLDGWTAHTWVPGTNLGAADNPGLLHRAWLRFHEVTCTATWPATCSGRSRAGWR
jgi:hypothetical protein